VADVNDPVSDVIDQVLRCIHGAERVDRALEDRQGALRERRLPGSVANGCRILAGRECGYDGNRGDDALALIGAPVDEVHAVATVCESLGIAGRNLWATLAEAVLSGKPETLDDARRCARGAAELCLALGWHDRLAAEMEGQ
jgi:hypothetical protein